MPVKADEFERLNYIHLHMNVIRHSPEYQEGHKCSVKFPIPGMQWQHMTPELVTVSADYEYNRKTVTVKSESARRASHVWRYITYIILCMIV